MTDIIWICTSIKYNISRKCPDFQFIPKFPISFNDRDQDIENMLSIKQTSGLPCLYRFNANLNACFTWLFLFGSIHVSLKQEMHERLHATGRGVVPGTRWRQQGVSDAVRWQVRWFMPWDAWDFLTFWLGRFAKNLEVCLFTPFISEEHFTSNNQAAGYKT